MKSLALTCSILLYLTVPLSAQEKAQPPAADRLDVILQAWEKRMTGVASLATRCERTDVHPLTKKQTTFVGDAAFMKPTMARIDLTHQDEVGKADAEKTNFERIFCDGKYIYEFSPRDKKIIVHDVPKNDPTADNMILAFLKGMKSDDARRRFHITLSKETEWYAYLMIQPKTDSDKQEFAAAQLTIWIKNPNPEGKPNLVMMPARLWYRQPNGKEVTYMFSDLSPNAKLDEKSFIPRQIVGYKVERAADAVPPTPMPTPKTVRQSPP